MKDLFNNFSEILISSPRACGIMKIFLLVTAPLLWLLRECITNFNYYYYYKVFLLNCQTTVESSWHDFTVIKGGEEDLIEFQNFDRR